MMQRLSSNCNENMVGPCYSCGYFHHGGQANCSSFSMIFSMPNHHMAAESYEDCSDNNMYGFQTSSSPSVDCTLSLGPPSSSSSSRFTHENEKRNSRRSFCNWDILQTNTSSSSPSSAQKSHRGGARVNSNNGGDTLLARRCSNCDTTSTPLWRNGPRGPKSLCNACGIRYKKEERRASAAAAVTNRGGAAAVVETQHIINGSSSWMHHSAYGNNNNEFRFIQEDDAADVDNNSGIYVFPLLASQHY